MVKLSAAKGVLMVNAKIEGHKVVRLFDVNGTLLMTKSFDGEFCEVRMDKHRGKPFAVVTLEVDGRLVKTQKVRMK